MTRWSAITRTRGRRSALAYGSHSTTAAEDNLNPLIHHEQGRYYSQGQASPPSIFSWLQIGAEDYTNGSAFTSCSLRIDGAILCWGDNSAGQRTPPAGPYTQFDLGSWFGCGLRADGTVTCWGKNDSGESTPPSGAFVGVTTGDAHACGTRAAGSVTCWGSNDLGELGGTPPKFTSAAPPGAVVGQAYNHSYTASGLAVNSFKVTSGALPPGLTLNSSTGSLSGSPTSAGTFSGSVTPEFRS